jgi:CubicO group peptidase (beta-lactamase class C family)
VVEIHGFADEGFGPVWDAFRANFETKGEIGASCCIYNGTKPVVDIWAGMAAKDRAWDEETLCLVFSTTKGATSVLANSFSLNWDDSVASIWPEFANNNKEKITIRQLISHRAGLPYIESRLDLADVIAWHPVIKALETQRPIWEPGTAHGYHATTFGWLVGEVIRRVSNKSAFSQVFEEKIRKPLNLDFYIGLPESLNSRVAVLDLIKPPEDPKALEIYNMFVGPDTLTGKALASPSPALADMDVWNNPQLYKAEIPSANAITNARNLAKLYAATFNEIDGVKLLSDVQIKEATQCQTSGNDRVLFFETKFGLGFMLSGKFSLYALDGAFGHDGAGGSVGFADPVRNVSFGYVMNKMLVTINGDPRSHELVDAMYKCLNEDSPLKTFN